MKFFKKHREVVDFRNSVWSKFQIKPHQLRHVKISANMYVQVIQGFSVTFLKVSLGTRTLFFPKTF